MLAMSLLIAVFELRDHRGLDGDLKAEGDRRRTPWGRSAAEDGGGETFLPREEWAKPRGRMSDRRHCGKAIEALPSCGQIEPSRGRAGRAPDSHRWEKTWQTRPAQEARLSGRRNRNAGVQKSGRNSPGPSTALVPQTRVCRRRTSLPSD